VGKRTCVDVHASGYGGPGVTRAVVTLAGARRVTDRDEKARICARFSRRGNFPLIVHAKSYPKSKTQIAAGARRRSLSPGPTQLGGSTATTAVNFDYSGSMTLESSQMDTYGHWQSLPTSVSDSNPATLSAYSKHIAYGPEGSANYTSPDGSWQLQLGLPYAGPAYAGCGFAGDYTYGPEFCSVQGQLAKVAATTT
jgi:hypothetical protein